MKGGVPTLKATVSGGGAGGVGGGGGEVQGGEGERGGMDNMIAAIRAGAAFRRNNA